MQEQLPSTTEVRTDARWNEFKLGAIYQSLAAHLGDDEARFAQGFAEMKRRLSENAYVMSSAVARGDRAVMQAWLEDRYPAEGCER